MTLLEESLEFGLSKRDGIVIFNLGFVLLPTEINSILEKQSCKRDIFVAYGSSHVEIILILLREVIVLYMQAFIVKVRVLSLEKAIAGCGTCLELAMFLAFNKQFSG